MTITDIPAEETHDKPAPRAERTRITGGIVRDYLERPDIRTRLSVYFNPTQNQLRLRVTSLVVDYLATLDVVQLAQLHECTRAGAETSIGPLPAAAEVFGEELKHAPIRTIIATAIQPAKDGTWGVETDIPTVMSSVRTAARTNGGVSF